MDEVDEHVLLAVGCVRYAVISELMQATFVKEQHHLRTQNISKSFICHTSETTWLCLFKVKVISEPQESIRVVLISVSVSLFVVSY